MNHKLFQIFRAGTFSAMNGQRLSFSDSDLHQMAAAFDPKFRPAPLVLGHPEDDQPEMGKVQKLVVKDGKLYALALVGTALEALVKARRYAKVSAAFIAPFGADNPTPGAYYLRHVGFLGATPPAVKGMEPPSFAARDDGVCFGESEPIIQTQAGTASLVRGMNYDKERLALHHLASEYREVCPALSYSEAVTLAQDALTF